MSCKRCGLNMSTHLPDIIDIKKISESFNPDFCAWCNMVAVGRIVAERTPNAITPAKYAQQKISAGVCPECGGTLWMQSNCYNCQSCGFEKCG